MYGEYGDNTTLSPVADHTMWVAYSRHEQRAVRMASAIFKAIDKSQLSIGETFSITGANAPKVGDYVKCRYYIANMGCSGSLPITGLRVWLDYSGQHRANMGLVGVSTNYLTLVKFLYT